MTRLTPEQERAVERRDGPLMVRAGAGTGKTTVLVERFVRAVVEDGAGVEQMLAITFTEKAAAEMRARVRRRFVELGLVQEARAAESAWISTIHGLCARILRAHALSAGIDPGFRVLDELDSERLARLLRSCARGVHGRRHGPGAHRARGRLHARWAARHGAHRAHSPAQPRRAGRVCRRLLRSSPRTRVRPPTSSGCTACCASCSSSSTSASSAPSASAPGSISRTSS